LFWATLLLSKNIKNKGVFMSQDYNAGDLSVLDDLEAVRERPGMYIDYTDKRGIHKIVDEIFDNSVDEFLAGHCNKITVVIEPEGYPTGSISIKDNGRGMPTDINEKEGISGLEIIFTKLHGGGKFSNSTYKVSGGLHGVGASVTNFVSKFLTVIVCRDGQKYMQCFEYGKKVGDLQELGATNNETGTEVIFQPDPFIFEEALENNEMGFDKAIIEEKLKLTSYLNKKLSIIFKDNRIKSDELFYSEEGISELVMVNVKNSEKTMTEKTINFQFEDTMNSKGKVQEMEADVSFIFEKDNFSSNVLTFVNNITTKDGGRHLQGLRKAFNDVVNKYGQENLKIDKELRIEDIFEGMSLVLSLKMSDPQFGGQTKNSLTSGIAQTFVSEGIKEKLSTYLEENPDEAKELVRKSLFARNAREQMEKNKLKIRKETEAGVFGHLPGKLADCQSTNILENEIFVVEGDSAGGSAKQGRARKIQAILPLKGKVLNVAKADSVKIHNSEQIQNFVDAIGTGYGDQFDIARLRYGKIILMTDADVDGLHIALLMQTLILLGAIDLIKEGRIYLAKPPLYSVKSKRAKASAKTNYLMDDQELLDFIGGEENRDLFHIQRFKGLGEMNPPQLWDTTMNPETRVLQQLVISDIEKTMSVFEDLMGTNVQPRSLFLEKNAQFAELDI
jgi:DNA gyrase subunit B